jgi:myo-inositol-1(or 4)-monophosphatase
MLEKEQEHVRTVIKEAGKAILCIAERYHPSAAKQADRRVLTRADLEANRIIKGHLTREFLDYGWLSEETRDDKERLKCKRVWIVDPMDGTREFVMKNPEFVVSIALVEDGRPILGAIYNPSTDDLYEGALGQGTRLNGRPVYCKHALGERPRIEVSRSDIEKGRFSGFKTSVHLVPCGSIAYKLARLAAGMADATVSITPKNEWDIAAGVLLVQEAGGRVTDLKGSLHDFNQPDTLVDGVMAASNEAFDRVKGVVDRVRRL